MIEALLPPTVVAVEEFEDVPGEAPFPGEEDLIDKAVEGRRREFITARRCARAALRAFGHPDAPIRPGPKREPRWPAGMTGSITHCAGYRAAAVARTVDASLLGIDAEPNGPLPDGVALSITVPGEPEMLDRLARSHPDVQWGRLLFSAKESVYKAWFPVTRRWLGFEEARLAIDPDRGTFAATLLVDGSRVDGGAPLSVLHGRFVADRGLLVTAVVAS
ncbi:4'-phosphopantetheinyl transferase superfamily protein [Paractinoplanes ferrugineus]|uniref:4'-phosphopantetheinyl transferase n=1 Tax=Paractinoplanes ferrugineus TaxID=113564 RepID=A0A919MEG9_9ACTN|nr:4'-phosphopantetheinyl transferase superfamily protein [Actinoplanes ferrugineus]GIE12768.1 4'-phosphopantetheinyl transferase [Actinoplanes ferrugineus]